MTPKARLISIGEPGHTDALEFEDGKLMLCKFETLGDVSWDRIVERVGQVELEMHFTGSSLVAMNNWTMIPQMNDIWENVLALLDGKHVNARFFFDLVDPEIHNDETLLNGCRLLSRFQQFGEAILGVNEKEAFRVAGVLGYQASGSGREDVRGAAACISGELSMTVAVHPRAYAVTASHGKVTADVDGPFCDNPKISTGAGDHFNAGFCLGKMLGLPDDQAVTAGVGTSGYYVRNAASPSLEQLAQFLTTQAC
jgi:sugar/nucleoside kinase (ribokinase family)